MGIRGIGRRLTGLNGPYGSHDRPASPLYMRLGLAIFGAVVLLAGAVAAALLTDAVAFVVILAAGFLVALINIYWLSRRIRWER